MTELKKESFIGKIADFVVRTTMVFTTVLALLFFADYYDRFELVLLGLIFLVAIVTKGISNFVGGRKK